MELRIVKVDPRGYAFADSDTDDTRGVFIHARDFQGDWNLVAVGDLIEAMVTKGDKGWKATSAARIGEAPVTVVPAAPSDPFAVLEAERYNARLDNFDRAVIGCVLQLREQLAAR